MLESLDVNLGKVSDNDFKESDSITIVRKLLEKNKKIKVRATEADKIPNLDGKLMILDDNSMERITVEVQIKTLPSNYQDTTPYKYSCDTKVFNVVKNNVTFNPVVLLMVDVKNEIVFWKYISKEYVKLLNITNQKNKTIQFEKKDIYQENQFISSMITIFKHLGIILEKGSNPYLLIEQNNPHFKEMQEEVDRLNNIFDSGLKNVKNLLFPKVWKFGIAYNEYDGFSELGIYAIYKGKNDTLVRNFDIANDDYMRINITCPMGTKSIRKDINDWIQNVLNTYFNVKGLDPKYLPNMVLCEIVFDFLDRLARDIKELQGDENKNYLNNIESLDNVLKYYKGLKTYYYRLVKELPNSQLTKALLNVYKTYGNKFLLFNPFLQPNEEEYSLLIDSLNNPRELPCKINFISSDIDIELFENVLKELEKRKIFEIKRVWQTHKWDLYKQEQLEKRLHTQAHGFTIKDLYQNIDKFFENITNLYKETYKNIFESNSNYMLNGEFVITYNSNTPYNYNLFFHKSNTFSINFEHMAESESKENYGNFTYYESSSSGNIDSIFGIKLPLYNYVRFLINFGISLYYGLVFKYDSEINQFYLIKELPIISDYILLCKEKVEKNGENNYE